MTPCLANTNTRSLFTLICSQSQHNVIKNTNIRWNYRNCIHLYVSGLTVYGLQIVFAMQFLLKPLYIFFCWVQLGVLCLRHEAHPLLSHIYIYYCWNAASAFQVLFFESLFKHLLLLLLLFLPRHLSAPSNLQLLKPFRYQKIQPFQAMTAISFQLCTSYA